MASLWYNYTSNTKNIYPKEMGTWVVCSMLLKNISSVKKLLQLIFDFNSSQNNYSVRITTENRPLRGWTKPTRKRCMLVKVDHHFPNFPGWIFDQPPPRNASQFLFSWILSIFWIKNPHQPLPPPSAKAYPSSWMPPVAGDAQRAELGHLGWSMLNHHQPLVVSTNPCATNLGAWL